jgi:hypothetical protein
LSIYRIACTWIEHGISVVGKELQEGVEIEASVSYKMMNEFTESDMCIK